MNGIKLEIFHVDSFTKEMFRGNPAMVCISDKLIDDELMKNIASEVNLSETAFVVPRVKDKKEGNEYNIRWFTPKKEVDLCGHATLAASKVLFSHMNITSGEIIYHSNSGILKAKKDSYGISLDFPLDEAEEISTNRYEDLLSTMGISSYENIFMGKYTKKLVVHLNNQEKVLNVSPNYERMKSLNVEGVKGVGITAIGDNKYDFITRYFNPWVGVNEDPVTGSVHTLLANYWSQVLEINELKAYQGSLRGGEMILRIKDNKRLEIIGDAKTVFKGELYIDYNKYK